MHCHSCYIVIQVRAALLLLATAAETLYDSGFILPIPVGDDLLIAASMACQRWPDGTADDAISAKHVFQAGC